MRPLLRSRYVRFGRHRYWQCLASRNFGRSYGWYATGLGVPQAGPIRWGRRTGYVRAVLDSIRLAWRHR